MFFHRRRLNPSSWGLLTVSLLLTITVVLRVQSAHPQLEPGRYGITQPRRQCSYAQCKQLLGPTHFDISCRSGSCFGCRWASGGRTQVSRNDYVTCESVNLPTAAETSSNEPLAVMPPSRGKQRLQEYKQVAGGSAQAAAAAAAAPRPDLEANEAKARLPLPDTARSDAASVDLTHTRTYHDDLSIASTGQAGQSGGTLVTDDTSQLSSSPSDATRSSTEEEAFPAWLLELITSVESPSTKVALLAWSKQIVEIKQFYSPQVIKEKLAYVAQAAKAAARLEAGQKLKIMEAGRDWK